MPGAHTALSAGAREFVPGGPAGGAASAEARSFLSAQASVFVPGSTGGGRTGDGGAHASSSSAAQGSRAGATPLRAALNSRAQVFVPRGAVPGTEMQNAWGQTANMAAPPASTASVPQPAAPAMPAPAFFPYENVPQTSAPHNATAPAAPVPAQAAATVPASTRLSSQLNPAAQEFTPGGGGAASSLMQSPEEQAAPPQVAPAPSMPVQDSLLPSLSLEAPSSWKGKASSNFFNLSAYSDAESEEDFPLGRSTARAAASSAMAGIGRGVPDGPQNRAAPRELWGSAAAAEARSCASTAAARGAGAAPMASEDCESHDSSYGRFLGQGRAPDLRAEQDAADEAFQSPLHCRDQEPGADSLDAMLIPPSVAEEEEEEFQADRNMDCQVKSQDATQSTASNSSAGETAGGRLFGWARRKVQADATDFPRLGSLPRKVAVRRPAAAVEQQAPEARRPLPVLRALGSGGGAEGASVVAKLNAIARKRSESEEIMATPRNEEDDDDQWQTPEDSEAEDFEVLKDEQEEGSTTGRSLEETTEETSHEAGSREALMGEEAGRDEALMGEEADGEGMIETPVEAEAEEEESFHEVEETHKAPAWRQCESDRSRQVERLRDDETQERRHRPWQNYLQQQVSAEAEGAVQGRLGTSPTSISTEPLNKKVLLRWRAAVQAENLRAEGIHYYTSDLTSHATSRGGNDRAVSEGVSGSPGAAVSSGTNWRDDARRAQQERDRDKDRGARRDGANDLNRKSEKRREREEKAAKLLEISPSSWVAQQLQHRETKKGKDVEKKNDTEVVREMKLILNKLTIEKFESLFMQLTACGISSEEHVEILMCEVFEKATTQHHFIGMYADLCVQLHIWFTESQVSGCDGKLFKRILLNQCQLSFEQNLSTREDFSQLDPEKRLEAEHRHKTRMLGNLRFVGALLEKGMLASKILLAVVEKLLEGWTPVTLECLSVFLVAVGPAFDRPEWMYHAQLKEVFNQVRLVGLSPDIPSRVRFLLQDVLDLRASGWKNEKKAVQMDNGPMTLEAIHKQAEEELGEKISVPRPGVGGTSSSWRPHSEVATGERSSDRRNYREGGSSGTRSAPVFNIEGFHAELPKVLKELRQSLDIDAAFERITAYGVPYEHQASEFADLLAAICEMGQATARVAAFKFAVRLFLKGSWQKKALTDGLCRFFGEMYFELKIDLPNLPRIVREELAPALGGLVDAGLLSTRLREELLNIV